MTARLANRVCREHGAQLYLFGCALLGKCPEAEALVVDSIVAFCSEPGQTLPSDPQATRRAISRDLFLRCQRIRATSSLDQQTRWLPAMAWLDQISFQQRAAVAMCLFGAHTYREAAELLDVPALTAANLLRGALLELSAVRPT